MNSFEAVIVLVCMIFVGIILGEYMKIQTPVVYACSEVTKKDLQDVQLLCKRKVRKYGD
jgi:hypothetical protein